MKKLLFLWYLALAAVAAGQVKVSELPALTGSGAVSTDVLPIVDVSAGASGSKKITLADLFSTPVPWQGVVITGQYGGTGVANTGKTITLGGNLTTSGAFPTTITVTGTTSVTLPTSGTLATAASVTALEGEVTDLDATKADLSGANIDTEAERATFRGNALLQSSEVGFLDQFDNTTRYPDPTSITTNVTTPEVGSAWRLHVPGGSSGSPSVTSRAFAPHMDSLCYLGGSVPSRGGKFSIGFEFTAAAGSSSWINRMGLNISFNDEEMIPSDGSGIYPSAGGGVVHINFSDTGVTTAASPQFFGGASLTCLNATSDGTQYPWFPGYPGMVADQRYTLLYEVDGDYLRITLVGVGSLLFYHASLSDHVGASSTNFWWEPNGATYSSDYRLVPKLHRVWSGDALNQSAAFGARPFASLLSQMHVAYKGRIFALGHAGDSWVNGNEPSSTGDYYFATPAKIRADRGFRSRPFSGTSDYIVPLSGSLFGAELSSSAAASNADMVTLADFALATVGDRIENEVIGSFAANGNTKAIRLYFHPWTGAWVTTGSITPNGGTWKVRVIRKRLTGRSHDFYGEISVTSGGTTTVYTDRVEANSGTLAIAPTIQVTGTSAGDVKAQHGDFEMRLEQ